MKIRSKFISGTFWSFFGQMFSLLLGLLVNIWLAQYLDPSDFGRIAIIMFFISVFTIFSEGGMSGALIRKIKVEPIDYSTVFIFNFLVSCIAYFLIYVSAEPISNYYDSDLTSLLRASGLILILNAFQFNQNTRLIVEMKFKRRALCRILSVVLSSVSGVLLAYLDYGIWSLVYMNILNSFLYSIFLYFGTFEKIRLKFSIETFKNLYAFGLNTTTASLINVFFDNIYQLILAKYFSLNQTGLYYQAKKIQDVPGGLINTLSQSVFFSAFSKIQNDKVLFNTSFDAIARYSLFVLGAISVFFFMYSKLVILVLYGESWVDATFYMQVLALASLFYIQELVNRIVFKVYNRTNLILRLELIKKAIQLVSIFIGVVLVDLRVLLIGYIVVSGISYFINVYYSSAILDIDYRNEFRKLSGFVLLFAFTILCAYGLGYYFDLSTVKSLFWLIPVFFVYTIISIFFKFLNVKKDIVIFRRLFSII